MKTVRLLLTFFSLSLLSAGLASGSSTEYRGSECEPLTGIDKQAVDQLVREHVTAHQLADADGAVKIYASDIRMIWGLDYDESGRENVRESYRLSYLDTKIESLNYFPEEFLRCGSIAYEIGTLHLLSLTAGKKLLTRDRYMALWRKVEGTWRLFRVQGFNLHVKPLP